MKTISISKLVGTEAVSISRRVTDALGYDLVDRVVLEGAFRQYGLTKFGDLYTAPPNIWDLANSTNLMIVSMLNDIVEGLAHRGRTVILLRGGYAPLCKYADVLKVRLQAPLKVRVERVMAREASNNWRQAEKRVKADDKARKKFTELFYGQKWDTAWDFDLVVDTGTISIEMTADWIIEAARALDTKEFPDDVVTARQAKVDPLLLDAIDQALERRAHASKYGQGK